MCETLHLHSPESNWNVLLLIFQSVSAMKRNQKVQRGDVQVEGLSSVEMRQRQKADFEKKGLELELQPRGKPQEEMR